MALNLGALTVEPKSKKLYFADREGTSVLRCDYDGGNLEVLVRNGDWKNEGFDDATKWCVGITVAPTLGKFYWTQKGPPKGGKGRIFCAHIDSLLIRSPVQTFSSFKVTHRNRFILRLMKKEMNYTGLIVASCLTVTPLIVPNSITILDFLSCGTANRTRSSCWV